MKNNFNRKANGYRGAVSFFIHHSFFIILLLIICSGFSAVSAQEAEQMPVGEALQQAERVTIDGSSLQAGEAFRFTVTVNSDEMRSFSDSQSRLTAVLCPTDAASGNCQTLTQTTEGEDDVVMRVVFTANALPAAGDYTLDVNFVDNTGVFAQQTVSYLMKGVRAEGEPADVSPTDVVSEETPVSETLSAELTETPEPLGTEEPVFDVPVTVKPVTIAPVILDAEGNTLGYSSNLYVGETYTFLIHADSSMNNSVTLEAALPGSVQSLSLDPECSCSRYLNSEGTAFRIPGELFNADSGNDFRCELRYIDRAWLPGEALTFSITASGIPAEETYEMQPLAWYSYPVNITQFAASHQARIFDTRGNLLCGDTVQCGMFNSDEVYILTYNFPAEWDGALVPGKVLSADLTWPAEWAASLQQPGNIAAASAVGDPCYVNDEGKTTLELKEISGGRYSASCAFTPGAITGAVLPSVNVHLNDNAWAVRDLSIGLSPVIIRETAVPVTEITPEPTSEFTEPEPTNLPESITEEPEDTTETPEPLFDIPMTVTHVTLTPSVTDGSGNNLIYGSTLYVGEPYYFQLHSDIPMNDTVLIEAALPASLQTAPLDPFCECMQYLSGDGSAIRIPGSAFSVENGGTFRCELRYIDRAWLTAEPVNFSVVPSGWTESPETFEMTPLAWNYYPVNIAQYAATHQARISDARGNVLCGDTVPCGMFNADDVYVLTYKFPADWSSAMPSGRSFSADVTWPYDWAAALQNSPDYALAAEYGDVCTVSPDGVTHFDLHEVSEGRYEASCTFVPSGITNPVPSPLSVHLNDNSWAVSDLQVYMPSSIVKRQAVLSPSLVLQMTEDAAEDEQIRGGTIGRMYRTTVDYPNNGAGFGHPALYTLKAQIEGISSARTPQWGDYILVQWPLFDSLMQQGDLPSCLVPSGNGYILGSLVQTEDGKWEAECSFRFPQSLSDSTAAGTLYMELFSGVYNTSASVQMQGEPFRKDTVTVDLTVPEHMLPKQSTEFRARITDGSGSLSDYLRAVLNDSGAALRADWEYNYVSDCQGNYVFDMDGNAVCTAYFEQTTAEGSGIHYELLAPALETLFDVVYSPSQDFRIKPVSRPVADLTVRLFHAGTEISLPAAADEAFIVGEDYQLQFYLTPDPEYRDVLNSVSVDGEGMVQDWWQPLLVRWGVLPGGEVSLNFYRDGDSFIARYDFNFGEGDITLEGSMSQLVIEPWIDGWDINIQNGMEPIQMPARINKKPLTLGFSDFTVGLNEGTVSDLHVNDDAHFDVYFNGAFEHFDELKLQVGYEEDGIRTPVMCVPDYDAGSIHCSFTPVCTDYSGGDYAAVCGGNKALYAEYAGDPYNEAASADLKSFTVKRGEIHFTPMEEGSLSRQDLFTLQAASEDLQTMGYASVTVGSWNVDSFLPREIRTVDGPEYKVYPVLFRYEKSGSEPIDDTLLRMDVKYQTGNREAAVDRTISLKPRMFTDDMVMFELEFGSYEMLDDGTTVREALEEAVTITGLTVRYPGSPLYGPASSDYKAEDLTFALKVASLLDFDPDNFNPGVLSFRGAASSEMLMSPFRVYCSQLYEPLMCSLETPSEILNEKGEPVLTEGTEADCWGGLELSAGSSEIYVNGYFYPQCYLTSWVDNSRIMIAADVN